MCMCVYAILTYKCVHVYVFMSNMYVCTSMCVCVRWNISCLLRRSIKLIVTAHTAAEPCTIYSNQRYVHSTVQYSTWQYSTWQYSRAQISTEQYCVVELSLSLLSYPSLLPLILLTSFTSFRSIVYLIHLFPPSYPSPSIYPLYLFFFTTLTLHLFSFPLYFLLPLFFLTYSSSPSFTFFSLSLSFLPPFSSPNPHPKSSFSPLSFIL